MDKRIDQLPETLKRRLKLLQKYCSQLPYFEQKLSIELVLYETIVTFFENGFIQKHTDIRKISCKMVEAELIKRGFDREDLMVLFSADLLVNILMRLHYSDNCSFNIHKDPIEKSFMKVFDSIPFKVYI